MNRTVYVLYRLFSMIPTLIGVVILIFFLTQSIKGDPARMMAGDAADAQMLEQLRREFQLDQPLPVRLASYFANLAHGNLGISYSTKRPVLESLMERLPATLELTLASLVFAFAGAVPLGVISAVKRNQPIDQLVRVLSVGGVSMPVFWSGLMLIWLFYGKLEWLPGAGRLSVYTQPPTHITGMYTLDSLLTGNWPVLWESLKYLILPAFVLGYAYMATLSRLIRSSMLDVLGQDYVRTARAKGLSARTVIFRHALRNALIPVTTLAGLAFAALLGGAVLTETIFSWPGIGKYVVDAVLYLDYPVIMGFTLLIAIVYMLVNLGVDLLYSWLNPQIQ
ncbi:MAG: ABC transporter permease [Chloroflexi bacterium]|nr:ABC transporter permease [Chloroflexota bacterium]